MHEMSLVAGLVEAVANNARSKGIGRVSKVRLLVGEFTAAFPDALKLAFANLTRNSVLEWAELEIKEIPLLLKCGRCRHAFHPGDIIFACPSCGSPDTRIIEGRELRVDYYEGYPECQAQADDGGGTRDE